jgi:hypothetical protein
LKSRDLLDLGPDISAHIQYDGRHGFWIDPEIEEKLLTMGANFVSEDLEALFKPFLRPDIQKIIDRFERGKSRKAQTCDLGALAPEHRGVHLFDARRLYYLRMGRIDSGELGVKHWKFLNVFLCKSRDEIESLIEEMERQLPPRENANYVYASLGISLLLPEALRDHPGGLDREKMDRFVTETLCRINSDQTFFLGVDGHKGEGADLHPYLTKYAWLYFDFPFQADSPFESFRFERGFGRAPASPPPMAAHAACELFGITEEQFARMKRGDVMRLFRRKAKRVHPDKGGTHESFLALSRAYAILLGMKK